MPVSEIPIVDISPLRQTDPKAWAACAAAIGAACRGIGFFYVVGHGVEPAQMRRVFATAAAFFDRPLAEKMAVALTPDSGFRGYFPPDGEITDPAVGADPKEGFDIAGEIVSDLPSVRRLRRPNQWPVDPPDLCEVLSGYYEVMGEVGRAVSRGFALSLGLPAGFFADKLDHPTAILRILHYPPIARDALAGEVPLNGCGAHSDYGYLTMLAQDRQGGLQIQTRAGDWVDAPYVPDSFICNVGEMMAMWTDGEFRATRHRVVRLAPESRYSIPFFFHPNPDVMIKALPGRTLSAGFEPVLAGDYLLSRLVGAYNPPAT
jgi:isopenicillin N synthase-like dioxygenase